MLEDEDSFEVVLLTLPLFPSLIFSLAAVGSHRLSQEPQPESARSRSICHPRGQPFAFASCLKRALTLSFLLSVHLPTYLPSYLIYASQAERLSRLSCFRSRSTRRRSLLFASPLSNLRDGRERRKNNVHNVSSLTSASEQVSKKKERRKRGEDVVVAYEKVRTKRQGQAGEGSVDELESKERVER